MCHFSKLTILSQVNPGIPSGIPRQCKAAHNQTITHLNIFGSKITHSYIYAAPGQIRYYFINSCTLDDTFKIVINQGSIGDCDRSFTLQRDEHIVYDCSNDGAMRNNTVVIVAG